MTRATALKLNALAISDIGGFYGAIQAWQAAKRESDAPPLIYGSELPLYGSTRNAKAPSAVTDTFVLLAKDRTGYAKISQLVSKGRLRAAKGDFLLSLEDLFAVGGHHLIVLAGGPRSALLRDLENQRTRAVHRTLGKLREAFGDALFLEVTRHHRPADRQRSRALVAAGHRHRILSVATNDVFFHSRKRKKLHDVLTCIDQRVPLAQAGRRLLPNSERCLKSPAEMAKLFCDMPEVVHRSVDVAKLCTFRLEEVRYTYTKEKAPKGESADSYLSRLAHHGLKKRLGEKQAAALRPQLRRELETIRALGYAGYFLTMRTVVEFCEANGILCQGRGSAANSLVCYALRITSVSPDQIDMLFERFISIERNEAPDIDLDIEHDRREEVIQFVYQRYGREHAAMVAETIRYRYKSAVRDVGKVLGLKEQSLARMTRYIAHGWDGQEDRAAHAAGLDPQGHTCKLLFSLANALLDFPRHLSIHVGGFILSSEPITAIAPLENARMEARTVVQWDKDDIEALGIFKVDLLGLGMLNVIARAFRLIQVERDTTLTLGTVPADDRATYQMICKADTIGVFQIESRAQMGMLPRLQPRCFYDLVVEVALVRPGPIQGGMVHPYLRRRRGEEKIEYPHEKLRPILSRTLGVPIFQEQVMKMAVAVAGYTPGEADQLRRDMAAWRRNGNMERHQDRLFQGMRSNGIKDHYAKRIIRQIEGFGSYGFPESHAAAFAHLAYVSAYLKCHYPAEFTAALINAQPMGFYQVATLVNDAYRHGVPIRNVCVQKSNWETKLERGALRLGLRLVRGLPEKQAKTIIYARTQAGKFRSIENLVRRSQLERKHLVALAAAGAFSSLMPARRQAIWRAWGLGGRDLVRNLDLHEPAVSFPTLAKNDELRLNYHFAKSFVESHPLKLLRSRLAKRGVLRSIDLPSAKAAASVEVAGLIIVRQRPTGPGGVVFMALEDETGLVDVVLSPEVFERHRRLILVAEMMLIRGVLQADGKARSVFATHLTNLHDKELAFRSRNFH